MVVILFMFGAKIECGFLKKKLINGQVSKMKKQNYIVIAFIILINACSENNENPKFIEVEEQDSFFQPRPEPNPDKNAYFGDLHVHTSNSFDAYTFGTLASPSDAYRFAQGEAIPHPTGYEIQLKQINGCSNTMQ